MADLVSPGVSITVTDESFYAATGVGTVPLLVVATRQNKSSSNGSGIAPYTTKAMAGKVRGIVSQRELLLNYGNPEFRSSGGTPLNGHELNEYGLEAARSYLAFANRAFVLRADIDLADLEPSATPPRPAPEHGTFWLDTQNSKFGVKRWNGMSWQPQVVTVARSQDLGPTGVPVNAVGLDHDMVAVMHNQDGTTSAIIRIFEKLSGSWFLIGSHGWKAMHGNDNTVPSLTLQVGSHLAIPQSRVDNTELQVGDLFLQTTAPNQGTSVSVNVYNQSTGQWVPETLIPAKYSAEAIQNYELRGGIEVGDLWLDFDEAPTGTMVLRRWKGGDAPGSSAVNFVTAMHSGLNRDTPIFSLDGHLGKVAMYISVNDSERNQEFIPVMFDTDDNSDGQATVADAASAINNFVSSTSLPPHLKDSLRTQIVETPQGTQIQFSQDSGYSVKFFTGEVSGWTPALLGITHWGPDPMSTNILNNMPEAYGAWEILSYQADDQAPRGELQDGTIWYDNVISKENVDILQNNGTSWNTVSKDINIGVLPPTQRSNGVDNLQVNDLWISTDDLENYPEIHRWSGSQWVKLDATDSDTNNGIIFADFRADKSSSLYNDAPNALLYPNGILAWNTSGSGGVVKRWNASEQRWVTVSGNRSDGSPYMLRKAQRHMVVQAMQAVLTGNEEIRNENLDFNLIAAPGYPELIDEMVSLNVDRKETAFILADSPMRLPSDITSITNWATNTAGADGNGEQGLITRYPYMAVYYPSGRSTAIDGSNIVVPASHLTLRTLAYNDQVAYPWFAPAGYQRGLVTNASSVGYVDAQSGDFVPVSLSEGQRDAMYIHNVNPIATFPSRGLVVFGQKTLSPTSSALDRVNVARLTVYIRTVLDEAVRPFLFEPNDEITRGNAKTVVDRFLSQLITTRALNDFVTVCDTSNNTPDRIDRNELWIDVAIQPIKAVEFIYIPIRIQNTLSVNS